MKMKTKLERIAQTVKIPVELDRKPREKAYDYLRRATLYMSGLQEYKETLR
jgi:hypothetical protein